MKKISGKLVQFSILSISALTLSLIPFLATSAGARADEADAKRLLNAMSDYMAAQEAISFDYDAMLEVVTDDDQKLALASSGTATLNRPDKIRATRSGGFADVEMIFDGKTMTFFGKTANLYAQINVPGTIYELIDVLRDEYNRPLPAADLLLPDSYDELMADVIDIKDLGSGVIGGVECDFLAFRKQEVDFQIWIAHGDRPYPCQYIITSKEVVHSPQYTIRISDWRTGAEVGSDDFGFENSTNAKKIDLKELTDTDELPENFTIGDAQ